MESELYEHSYQDPRHFSFGKNWKDFLHTLNQKRIEKAEQSLTDFLGGKESVSGKTFIDIGCGSGLFSLAAHRLGAKKVVSVDIDRFSLECASFLKKEAGNPPHWDIISGSALDTNFLHSLGTFDIVYSWGVLHHTGNMYHALTNIFPIVKETGKIYVALYNDNQRFFEGTSSFWVQAKRIYNRSPWVLKKFFEILYTFYYIFGLIINGKNPVSYIRNYTSLRGMNFCTDIKDWLGGYPYEYASTEKIIAFFNKYGFQCIKTVPARSIGCNEFLFIQKI